MTNYIIEGNDIDFFAEINKANNVINTMIAPKCLLSGEKLDYNYNHIAMQPFIQLCSSL